LLQIKKHEARIKIFKFSGCKIKLNAQPHAPYSHIRD